MNKLYILICAIVLSGCDNTPRSLDQVSKAENYCKARNSSLHTFYNMSSPGGYKTIAGFACTKGNIMYRIPYEELE